MSKNRLVKMFLFGLIALFSGCANPESQNRPAGAKFTFAEAAWIQDGEPALFEGEAWYPRDNVENLLESEVYHVGEYKGTRLYAEYSDVRPYNRIYTRFSKNRYRLFEKKLKSADDKS